LRRHCRLAASLPARERGHERYAIRERRLYASAPRIANWAYLLNEGLGTDSGDARFWRFKIVSIPMLIQEAQWPPFRETSSQGSQRDLVLNAPESIEPELARLPVASIHRSLKDSGKSLLSRLRHPKTKWMHLSPARRTRQRRRHTLVRLSQGTSKKFKCDFNRDTAGAP